MPVQEGRLSSLKNKISSKLKYDKNASHSCLAHFTLLIVASGLAALCGVNFVLDKNILLQSVVSATFCIFAGLLYAVYMIISRVLALVLTYAERSSKSNYYYYTDSVADNTNREVDSENSNNDASKKTQYYRKHKTKVDYASGYSSSSSSSDYDSDSEVKRYFIHSKRVVHRTQRLPRSVVISSMYLGGSGAFLAIPALCMWDFTVSSFFIGSMTVLSIIDFDKIVSDFRPNIDTGQAVTNLKIIRYCLHLAILATISSVVFLDSLVGDDSIVFGHLPVHGSNGSGETFISSDGIGLFLRWPLILLAASSPVLLRAGGGGVGPFMHSLPPSQTLETGLPVSILLAILVICWYSPLENTLLPSIKQFNGIHLATFIPMMVLGPSFISAALAFVLRGFKNRSSCTTAIILSCILVVRQQIHHSRRMRSGSDCAAVALCTLMLGVHVYFVVYKRKVEMGPVQSFPDVARGGIENKDIEEFDLPRYDNNQCEQDSLSESAIV